MDTTMDTALYLRLYLDENHSQVIDFQGSLQWGNFQGATFLRLRLRVRSPSPAFYPPVLSLWISLFYKNRQKNQIGPEFPAFGYKFAEIMDTCLDTKNIINIWESVIGRAFGAAFFICCKKLRYAF